MRIMQTTLAILVAFVCYGSFAKMYRRRRNRHPLGDRRKPIRAHDELRLTNL